MFLSEWREFPLNGITWGADKSLARPGRKEAIVCLLRRLALQEMTPDDSSRLDIVEITRVPEMLPSLFPSRSD